MKISIPKVVLFSLVMLGPDQAEANSPLVAIEKATSAVHDPYSRRVFVAAGQDGTIVLNAEDGSRVEVLPVAGTSIEVVRLGTNVAMVAINGEAVQISEKDPMSLVTLREFSYPHGSQAILAVVALNSDTLFLFSGQQGGFSGTVVSLREGRILQVLNHIANSIIYDKAVLSVRGSSLLIPGAYPGQVTEIDASDVNALKIKARHRVHDWIHQVTQISPSQAIIAGHLVGVSIVDLDSAREPEDELQATLLIADRQTHFLVRGRRLIAASPQGVYVANLDTLGVLTREFVARGGMTDTLPIGLNERGQVLVLEVASGVHFIDL